MRWGELRRAAEALVERFKEKQVEECVFWPGVIGEGRGRLWVNGRLWLATRWIWTQVNGAIPENMQLCHVCDTPSCINPSHLFVGTQKDNIQDMMKKGRGQWQVDPKAFSEARLRGEEVHTAKLTEKDVVDIRKDFRTQKEIASDYKVDRTQISRIKRNKTWRHI